MIGLLDRPLDLVEIVAAAFGREKFRIIDEVEIVDGNDPFAHAELGWDEIWAVPDVEIRPCHHFCTESHPF